MVNLLQCSSQDFWPWIQSLGIQYHIGWDGLSFTLVALVSLMSLIAMGASFYVQHQVKTLIISLLLLETTLMGAFLSLDLVLFYVFFELSLIPVFMLISIWGGEKRVYAAIKFFLYTFLGSLFMLLGMIVLANLHKKVTGELSFSLLDIQSVVASGKFWEHYMPLQTLIFWAFAIAFMIKSPLFPFHSWLPITYKQSPAVVLIISAVLLKLGSYGFLRFCLPLFPDVIKAQIPILMALAVIGILYGAALAVIQSTVTGLIGYSSLSHMGIVMVGIFSLTHDGLMGGALQQINHGVTTGLLFLLAGLLFERTRTYVLKDYGGLKSQMPLLATFFLIGVLSSVGLPGLNGFVGEFLAFIGVFQASFNHLFGLNVWYGVLAVGGVILSAVYLLRLYQSLFYGSPAHPVLKKLKDLKFFEVAMASVLTFIIFQIGIYPQTVLRILEPSMKATRQMALMPAGERPIWKKKSKKVSLEIMIENQSKPMRKNTEIIVETKIKEPNENF